MTARAVASLLWFALGAALAAVAVADAPPVARAGWSRPTAPGVAVGVGYIVIVSGADNADRLIAVSSARARRVELHESRLDGGVARMRPLQSLELAAGATLKLAPGGVHLMLVGLTAPLIAGESVPLTLEFARAGPVVTVLEVRDSPPSATAATLPPAAARVPPSRVVTLAPHLTELVYAAGAGSRLVGTLEGSDYPPAARQLPRVGDVDRLDAERLLALHPDLVLLWGDGSPTAQRELLARLGLPVLSLEQHTLADVAASLERLGTVFGTAAVAGPAANALRADLSVLRERYAAAQRVRVFYQVWSRPLYTLGGRHVATELLDLCGADNVFADQPVSAFAVDEEAVYARDPDIIALTGTAAEDAEWLERWRSRAPLRAVTSGNVIALDPDLVNRMGPRIGQGAALMCARIAERRATLTHR